MPSVSSLLRSAQSRRKKVLDYEDSIAEYDFYLSAKNTDDYSKYRGHLEKRAKSQSDPSRRLTYVKKIDSARRTFTSHEIQRSTINVLEGRGSNQQKYNQMVGLYRYAISNDDLDLAQSLRSQLDSLDRTIQAENERSQRAYSSMARNQTTSVVDHVDKLVNGKDLPDGRLSLKELNEIFSQYGDEGINQVAQQLYKNKVTPGVASMWDLIDYTLNGNPATGEMGIFEVLDSYADQLPAADANRLRRKANDYLTQKKFELPGVGRVNYEELQQAIEAARAGNNLFVPGQKDGKNIFVRAKVGEHIWTRKPDGSYKLEQRYTLRTIKPGDKTGIFASQDGTFTDGKEQLSRQDVQEIADREGKSINTVLRERNIKEYTYEELLESVGIQRTDAEGMYQLTNANSFSDIAGLVGGQPFNLIINEDGDVQIRARDENGNDRLYAINLTDFGQAQLNEQFKEVDQFTRSLFETQNETIDLGKQTDPLKVISSVDQPSDFLQRMITGDELLTSNNPFDTLRLPEPQRIANFDISKANITRQDLNRRIERASKTIAGRIQQAISPSASQVNPQRQAKVDFQGGKVDLNRLAPHTKIKTGKVDSSNIKIAQPKKPKKAKNTSLSVKPVNNKLPTIVW